MSPELEELYQEVILDHSRRPRNFGDLSDAAVRVHGDNPSCGDEIHLGVKFGASGELQDIKEGSQPASLFEIPSDYQKFQMPPGMGNMPHPQR